MARTKCLDSSSASLFIQQAGPEKWTATSEFFKTPGNFVFYNSSRQDLAIQVSGYKLQVASQNAEVNIEKPEIYEVYIDVSEIEIEEEKTPIVEIKIDGKEIALGDWAIKRLGTGDWKIGQLGIKYVHPVRYEKLSNRVKVGEAELGEGKHLIKIKNQNAKGKNEQIKLLLVNKEERQRAEELIWQRLNQPGSKEAYIFSDVGQFYVP